MRSGLSLNIVMTGLSTFQKEYEGENIELYIFKICIKVMVKILFSYYQVHAGKHFNITVLIIIF